MKSKDCGGFDDVFNKAAWVVADTFKNFMNDTLIPAIEGACQTERKEGAHLRKPRPGEIIGTFENLSDNKNERCGIYAGSDSVIAVLAEPGGGGGVIKKVEIDEFLDGEISYFVIDMENFKDYINCDQQLSDELVGKNITLEFVSDEISLAKANSLIGLETGAASCDEMLAMALWCKTGLNDRDNLLFVKDLILVYKTCVYRDREDNAEADE
jgi:hypothetical protein